MIVCVYSLLCNFMLPLLIDFSVNILYIYATILCVGLPHTIWLHRYTVAPLSLSCCRQWYSVTWSKVLIVVSAARKFLTFELPVHN